MTDFGSASNQQGKSTCEHGYLGGTGCLICSARMTDTSASPERIAAVTELPPLDVTDEDRKANEDYSGVYLHCRGRQLLAALADVRKFEDADAARPDTIRLLHEALVAKESFADTVASQAAEMAALRSAKEKAEADEARAHRFALQWHQMWLLRMNRTLNIEEWTAEYQKVFNGELRAEAAEAENMRLRNALQRAFDYYMGPHACGDFTCICNNCGLCEMRELTRAALSAPGAKREK